MPCSFALVLLTLASICRGGLTLSKPVINEHSLDNCIKRKKFTYLNTVGQREKESLTQFLTRWRDEVDKVEEMDDKTAMSLLMNAFRSGDLYTEFCRRPPSSYQEAYNTAWEYVEAEVLNKSKRELEEGYTKAKTDKPKKDDQTGGSKPRATYDESVNQIRDDKKGEQPKRPWTEKWCTYHQSDSHNTADCRNVKAVLKEMALKGELGEGHIKGNVEAKGEKMQRYRDLARALLKDLTEYVMEQIPRGENTDADLLSKLTQAAPEHVSKLARIETLEKASIDGVSVNVIEEDGQPNPDRVEPDDIWMDDLVRYYMTGKFPEDEDRVRKVKLRAPRFQMLDGRLYKRAFGGPLLICLTRAEAERVITEFMRVFAQPTKCPGHSRKGSFC
ncbi:unnamed protein product [Cuscuta campestris]|uniref:Retrotransposon gag domain-containing protein n=1 Tax=Cuscuta campestris TaxID=132261 RepID=A0A484MDZ2_9ASTE|nr:unnamed protein product [Cuscuta campestris]